MMSEAKRKKVGELLVSQGHITFEQLTQGLEKHHETGESLGAILIKLGFISAETLCDTLGRQVETEQRRRIGEILVAQGIIREADLRQALEGQKTSGLLLGKVLLKMGLLEEEKIIDVLSAQLDIPHVILENYAFRPELLALIPQELAQTYCMIPLFKQGNVLTLAVADSTNARNLDHVRFLTGLEVEYMLATEKSILHAISEAYAVPPVMETVSAPEQVPVKKEKPKEKPPQTELPERLHLQIRTSLGFLISQAIKEGATGIHLEPEASALRVRNRIGEKLVERSPIAIELYEPILARLKAMAGLNAFEKGKPQEGRFRLRAEGKEIDLRISIFPCVTQTREISENAVIQIAHPDTGKIELEKLGCNPGQLEQLKAQLGKTEGVLIIAGPEGSGKTTTLYAALRYINKPERSICTLEDPVEATIEGISQGQVTNALGFVQGIHHILHQDVDVIMVGDLRDRDTFEAASQAAREGRLVLCAINAYDSFDVYERLLRMGVDPLLLSSSVIGVLAQRLVRKVCNFCKESYSPSAELLERLKLPSGIPLYRGRGCRVCNGSGYKEKTGLFELLIADDALRTLIVQNASPEALRLDAIKRGFLPLQRDGLDKACIGLTSLEQILSMR